MAKMSIEVFCHHSGAHRRRGFQKDPVIPVCARLFLPGPEVTPLSPACARAKTRGGASGGKQTPGAHPCTARTLVLPAEASQLRTEQP